MKWYYGLAIIGMMWLTSCHNRVQFPGEVPSKRVVTYDHYFWLWGHLGEASYELSDACPQSKPYEIHTYTSMLQSGMTLVTLGILTPRTIEIICSGKGNSNLMEGEMRELPASEEASPEAPPRARTKASSTAKEARSTEPKATAPFDTH